MKRLISLVLLASGMTMFLVAASLAAPESAPLSSNISAAAKEGGPGPRIVFEEIEYDFGTLSSGQTVKHTFRFRNDGNTTLTISEVKPTCGCTGTLLSKKDILPGEHGEIEVTFSSGASGGQKKKSIEVTSNDPQQPKLELFIKAKIMVPVELRPFALYWMSEKGQQSSRMVELMLDKSVKMNITKLEMSSPAFKASVQTKKTPETFGYDIEIKYDGSLPVGEHKETLTILTDNPEHKKFEVGLRCKVVGSVKTAPDVVNLGVIKDDALPTRNIRVYSTSEKDFAITGVRTSNPLLKAEFSKEKVSNSYQVNISLTGKPPLGGFSEKLLIQTNDPEQVSIQMPVIAQVR